MITRLKRSRAGFTLVELIVVIAILAILAGVAIPVYSGYIKKANEAGDLQLLAAVNTAWAAACVSAGVVPTQVSGSATLTGEAGAKQLTAVGAISGGIAVPGFSEAFFTYFAGNEDRAFKEIEVLRYEQPDGVFKGFTANELANLSYSYTDSNGVTHTGTLNINADQLSTYLGSTWDKMGAAALTGKIDYLATQAANQFAAGGGAMLQSDAGFLSFIADDGYDWNGYIERVKTGAATEEDHAAVLGAQAKWNALNETEKANALVFYTASLADEINVSIIVDGLKAGSAPIENLTNPGAGGLVANGAVEYALLAAYCSDTNATLTIPGSSEEAARKGIKKTTEDGIRQAAVDKITELQSEHPNIVYSYDVVLRKDNGDGTGNWQYIITGTTPGEVYNASTWFQSQDISNLNSIIGDNGIFNTFMNSAEFSSYVDNQATSDLNAYVAALNLVNANTENVDIDSVLSQGWTAGGIADLIGTITGNP